jgi:hypothetical protein
MSEWNVHPDIIPDKVGGKYLVTNDLSIPPVVAFYTGKSSGMAPFVKVENFTPAGLHRCYWKPLPITSRLKMLFK